MSNRFKFMYAVLAAALAIAAFAAPSAYAAPKGPTIIDVAKAVNEQTGEFSILIAAINAADPAVARTLSGNGQFTVFAPTDAAFLSLLDELKLSAEDVLGNQALVTQVLLYHVARGNRDSAEVLASSRIRTLERGFLYQSGGVLTDANDRWLGLCILPASYLHLSDTLLEATGRPSRGRRRLAVRLGYLFSVVFVLLIGVGDWLVRGSSNAGGVPYLAVGPGIGLYAAFLAVTLGPTALNLWRAYRRCLTSASQRRMGYLMAGSVPPMLGALPLISFGLKPMLQQPVIFWSLNAALNVAVAVSMVLITYVVAYFGVASLTGW